MKIKHFTMQNVKGVNVFDYDFPQDGVVVLGGRNNQGKTSVLDGIAYTLGGEKMRPSNYKKMDVEGEPYMRCEFDNGIMAERIGETGDLRVVDETGTKKGQRLLDSFIETFALNVPKFLNGTERERNAALLQTIGIGDELDKLDEEEATEYEERTLIGRIADQKRKAVKEMPFYPNLPEAEISPSELMARLNEIQVRNAKAVAARQEIDKHKKTLESLLANGELLATHRQTAEKDGDTRDAEIKAGGESKKEQLRKQIAELQKILDGVDAEVAASLDQNKKACEENVGNIERQIKMNEEAIADMVEKIESAESKEIAAEDSSGIERQLAELEATNAKIRANISRAEKQADADESQRKYDEKTEKIQEIRRRRDTLLEGSNLPYPGLSYQNKHIYLDGKAWDCISESKKYIVACAIVMRINPNCKFVLMDKLEQMDGETLAEFDKWVKAHGLQVIATRVTANADECTIIIKNGYIEGMEDSIIVPHKIRRRAKKEGSESSGEEQSVSVQEERVPVNDTPTAKALTQDFSIEREEAVSEDTANAVSSAQSAMERAKALLAKRRAEIIASKKQEG